MGRLLTKLLASLVVMAMVSSLAWDGLVNGRLYDRTHGGSLDFWLVGRWVDHPVPVGHVASGRSLSEPDTIKAGWSISGLWWLWLSFVASSLLTSLAFVATRWVSRRRDFALMLARLILGGVFVYMGLNKALDPVPFLKLVCDYHLVENYVLLNIIASTLPWFEVFCGILLVAGVAVRGSALVLVLMLIPFTLIVLSRALTDPAFAGQAFRTIKFDCGCGNGEVFITHKLIENSLLVLFSSLLILWRSQKVALCYSIVKGKASANAPNQNESEVARVGT